MPAVLHLAAVAALMLVPPVIYYYASNLAELDAKVSVRNGAVAYVGAALIKIILLAVLGSEHHSIFRDSVLILVAMVDVPILWWCINKMNHHSIAIQDKFQAVGLGWMVADTVCRRAWPTAIAALAEHFTWDTVLSGVQANITLAHSCALAGLVTLMWSRKVKVGGLGATIVLMACFCAVLPQLPLILQQRGLLKPGIAVGVEAVSTLGMCVVALICHNAAGVKAL